MKQKLLFRSRTNKFKLKCLLVMGKLQIYFHNSHEQRDFGLIKHDFLSMTLLFLLLLTPINFLISNFNENFT